MNLHSIIPFSTASCIWSAIPALANLAKTLASVFPGPGPAASVFGISSCGNILLIVIVNSPFVTLIKKAHP